MATELAIRIRLDGAQATVVDAQRVQTALRGVNDEAAAGSRGAGGVRQVANEVESLSHRIGGMAKIGAGLLIGAGVISSLVELAAAYKEAATQADRLKSLYTFSFGSIGAGAENLAYVKGTANQLGTELLSTAEAYGKLAAASVGTSMEGQKTRAIFESVSKAATVLHLSSAETGGALQALQQMMSKGTVQSEELRGQLGERIPGAFQIAARAMGVTTAELGKMLEQGKVLSDDFLPKFAAEMEKTFGTAAEKAANSFSAQMNRMSNAWENLKMSLAAPSGANDGPGAIGNLAESLNTAAANMDRVAKNGHGLFARMFVGIGAMEMDVLAWLTGKRSMSGDGIARDQSWMNSKMAEISRQKAVEGDPNEGTYARLSAGNQAKVLRQELDQAIAATNRAGQAKWDAMSPEDKREARQKDAKDAIAKQMSDRLSLYDNFGKEAAKVNARVAKDLSLKEFDKQWAGMAAENKSYFNETRKRLVDKLDKAIANESRGAAGPAGRAAARDPLDGLLANYQRDAVAQGAGLSSSTVKEIENLGELLQRGKIDAREYGKLLDTVLDKDAVLNREQAQIDRSRLAQSAMGQSVDNLQARYDQQTAIYGEKQMTAPQRELEAALRKVEEAATAAREALAQKAATLEGRDVQALEAFRTAIIRVNEAEGEQKDRITALQAEQARLNGLWETGAERALNKYAASAISVADEVEGAFTRGFSGMEEALNSFATTGKLNFSSLANSLIADMIRIQMRAALAPVTQGLGGWLSGLLGGGGTVGGSIAGVMVNGVAGGPLSGTGLHSGGIVGNEATFLRFVHPSVFSGAPRLHAGGIASDEVPAILRKGEGVFTPGQMKAMGGASAPQINVTIHNQGAADGYQATAKARQNEVGIDLEVIVAKAVQADMRRNGPITQGFGSVFGLARAV